MKIANKGFTFIELTVVIFLIGLTLFLAVPKFRYAFLTDKLKTTVRRMVGTIAALKSEAIREQKVYMLHFNFESNRYWIETDGMTAEERALAGEKAFEIPDGVRIVDIWRREKGKKRIGEATIRFDKNGYVEHSVIHVSAEDGRQFSLLLSPFLTKVKVLKGYVEFEAS